MFVCISIYIYIYICILYAHTCYMIYVHLWYMSNVIYVIYDYMLSLATTSRRPHPPLYMTISLASKTNDSR